MCWACDHPDRPLSDYLDHLRALVRRSGWAVQTVGGEGKHPPFAYTVGLTTHDAPEILVSGLDHRESCELLNDMACEALHTASFAPGEQLQLDDGTWLEVVRVAQPTVHLLFAVELYGPDVVAVQLVHADPDGRWPWDVAYRGNQRVLGPRGPA